MSISSARSALLSLPREVGQHPEDGEPILAGIGRFGPYVQHGKTYANLEAGDEVLTVGLNRAVTLIAEKKAKGPRKGRFGADPGRALGEHPDKGGPVVVKNGRYGPYVSHAGVNATLPSDMTPETITLEQASALLDARAARGGRQAAPASRRKTARQGRAKRRQGRKPKPAAEAAKTAPAAQGRKAQADSPRLASRSPTQSLSMIGAQDAPDAQHSIDAGSLSSSEPSRPPAMQPDLPSPPRPTSSPSSAGNPARSARARSRAPSA